jgi:glycosyltransferase involved in cell wall biosynthesis
LSFTLLYFADIRFPLERANGIQTMETCHALARRGHRVSLVVRADTHEPARNPFVYYALDAIQNLRIETAPVAGPALARRAGYLAFAIGRALGAHRADAVFTRDLGVASALVRIPASLRPPIVYESHGYAPEVSEALPGLVVTAKKPDARKIARLRAREARVWRSAEGYVTITRGLADHLRSRLGDRDRLAVVPDGARTSASPPDRDRGASPPETVVGYAGHLYPWKGVDVVLEALARLPAARGLIVGGHESEPDLGRLKALAERLGIAARVSFTGLVPPARVPDLLRTADVLALPNPMSAISTHFTSPLKLFEYMAAARPIVASDLPAVREVLRHEETALLVPPGNPDALAAAVERIARDPSLASALAHSAWSAVREFSWDRRAERLEALLAQVVVTRE